MGLNELEAAEKSPSSKSAPFVFDLATEMGHEQVVFCNDPATGLKSIIAIHNTTLGPSMRGVRLWHSSSEEEALTDVMRLSRGMTFKTAISGLNAGGGKAVIIGDAGTDKNESLLRRFGRSSPSCWSTATTASRFTSRSVPRSSRASTTWHRR